MAERRVRRLDADALWEYALRALAGRAHSISDLREKLRRRAERSADVEAVLSRLKRYGYLDDRQFAANYAASRLQGQGFGKSRVLRDLRQKKVARAVAEQAVLEAYRGTDEVLLVEKFLRRKYRKVELGEFLAAPRNLASAYRKLRMAGFSGGAAISVLKRYAREPELLDSLETPEEPVDGPPSET
jgi:regulatory protein